jgi:hypothetical protein
MSAMAYLQKNLLLSDRLSTMGEFVHVLGRISEIFTINRQDSAKVFMLWPHAWPFPKHVQAEDLAQIVSLQAVPRCPSHKPGQKNVVLHVRPKTILTSSSPPSDAIVLHPRIARQSLTDTPKKARSKD